MTPDEHAEELASSLGVDKAEVKRDLENLLEYSVPVEEAKESLRRKYGDAPDSSGAPDPVNIADITTDDANITVTAQILTKGRRSIRYEGEERIIIEGELADESSRIAYTAWEEFEFEPGDTVQIGNANVREWEGDPELNLGESTRIEPVEDSFEVPYEVGGDAGLRDLSPGDRGRNVEVRIIETEQREIDGRDGPTEILSGVLADETARLPFTDWDPHEAITAEQDVRIENVYVREFRGVPSVNISEFSQVTLLDRTIEPAAATEMSIQEAVGTGGVFDIEITGHIVGIRDGSGLIQRCPECGRIVQKGQCRSHGEVDAEDDLRVKAIIDDGTGTVTAVLGTELTADLYGGDIEDARAQAREAMDQSVVADTLRDRIVGREFRIRGNLSVDDYGASLEATTFTPIESDAQAAAREFLEVYQ